MTSDSHLAGLFLNARGSTPKNIAPKILKNSSITRERKEGAALKQAFLPAGFS